MAAEEISELFQFVFSDQSFLEDSPVFNHHSSSGNSSSSGEELDTPPTSPGDSCGKKRRYPMVKEEAVDAIQRSLGDSNSALFSLTRDDLLKLSSDTLDNLAQTLASTRPLTDDERKQLKKQKRLIKNRESAQLSRQRKKVYLEDLEVKVSRLTEENDDIRRSLTSISEENRRVKEELFYWQHLALKTNEVPSTSLPSAAVLSSPTLPLSLLSAQKKAAGKPNMKLSGLYLLIVLLSFGLFFNSKKDNLPYGISPNQGIAIQQQQQQLQTSTTPLLSAAQQLQKLLLPGQQLDYSHMLLLLQQQMQMPKCGVSNIEPRPTSKKRKIKEENSPLPVQSASTLLTQASNPPPIVAGVETPSEMDECIWLIEEEVEKGKSCDLSPCSPSPIPQEDLAELVAVEMASGIPLLEDVNSCDREREREMMNSKSIEEEDTSLFLSSTLLDPSFNFASVSSSQFL
eukprot:TRINITY_DN2448_c0_g1_i1.p1 TRINITY_DN2448_c0_g1~~TRINITY_DN2448_c0_g1_i1.p1  ORF type:complete len:457 (-),score=119.89 TRINITY_DN2448_c0_g1_i1:230-1600(-)